MKASTEERESKLAELKRCKHWSFKPHPKGKKFLIFQIFASILEYYESLREVFLKHVAILKR